MMEDPVEVLGIPKSGKQMLDHRTKNMAMFFDKMADGTYIPKSLTAINKVLFLLELPSFYCIF